MRTARHIALVVLLCGAGSVPAQERTPLQTTTPAAPAPSPAVIAATVNGTNIQELAVFRALQRVPQSQRDEARKDVLNFLVDTILIDQYLDQLKVAVDAKEVDAGIKQMQDEADKIKRSLGDVLKDMYLTEAELRLQITNTLRWDKFVATYATEKALKDYFDQNRNMFDGSQVRARHILLPPAATPQAKEQHKAKLLGLKKQIEDKVAQELAKLPTATDNFGREKARMKLLDDTFAEVAVKESTCDSKNLGGDLGWFTRAGRIVDPFARVAFALKPYQMSDVVETEFGCHLILAVDQKTGRDVKFEEMRTVVQEVYAERLREAIITRARPVARIVVNAQAK